MVFGGNPQMSNHLDTLRCRASEKVFFEGEKLKEVGLKVLGVR